MAKSIYWNGIGDVQVCNETKKASKRIGIASIANVFSAKKEGDVRVFKMCNGNNVGIKNSNWIGFMLIHDNAQLRENIDVASLPAL